MVKSATLTVGDERSAIQKALAIIDVCSNSERPLTLGQLSLRAGIPKSTTHRIVKELLAWGALEHEEQRIRLGPRLFEVGATVPFARGLREVAVPYMEDLHLASRQVIHLGVLEGNDVLYVEKISGRRSTRIPTRPGGRMPAPSTGLGKAILAFSPPEVIERAITEGVAARRTGANVDGQALRVELEAILTTGVAFDRDENGLGASCVAAPILGQFGRPLGSISVTGPSDDFAPDQFAQPTRLVARAISRDLIRGARN